MTTLPEIDQYLKALAHQRGQVAAFLESVPVEGLNWRPPLSSGADPTNSLAVLAVHIAGSEHGWVAESIGGQPHTRLRDAEFAYVTTDAAEPLQRLNAVAAETKTVLENLTADQLSGSFSRDDHQVEVRWAILHVIQHYSLHIGHMELTYQLWNGGKAFQSNR
jgi:hypothetical protein